MTTGIHPDDPQQGASPPSAPGSCPDAGIGGFRLVWVSFFVAAGLLGFEIALMRLLLVASWHHFAFLVISIALLGFGTSGTALVLLRRWIVPRAEGVLLLFVLAGAASMPLCISVAQFVPLEARVVPALLWRQVGYWVLYWFLLGVPFFIGASALGLALMIARQGVPRVYAANLFGSAVGAATVTAMMRVIPAEWLCLVAAVALLIGAASLRPKSKPMLISAWLLVGALVVTSLAFGPRQVRVDPYKYGEYVRRLERQEQAERVAVAYGPRAVVEAYRGDVFHNLPFLSGGIAPPSMSVVLADGHLAGSVLDISQPGDAEAMDNTVMAFPYDLTPARPRVLLLGERGGANVWLAKRHDALSVHVVQPDANLSAVLRGALREYGGGVVDLPGVEAITAEPRHFVDQTHERFDLIQLVMLESSAAGSAGIGGLAQDHLLTEEGITACLQRLTEHGVLTVSRGIQDPPRDNLKLFATFAAALRASGAKEVGRHSMSLAAHVVIVRDYLAICTLVKASPWTAEQIAQVRRACAERELTPAWFPGITLEELNRPDELPGPPGMSGDWYYYAAQRLFSGDAHEFIHDWAFDIRPPTDDRPFFLDFCKLSSVGKLKDAYGDLWLTRTELAFLFVMAAIVTIGVVAALLTVLPIAMLREGRHARGRSATVAYFAAIGLGYMLLEMTYLSRLTHWIGDPVTAAAVTISGFLFVSGLGSLTAQRLGENARRWVPWLVAALIFVGLIEQVSMSRLAAPVGSLPIWLRCSAAFLAIAPVGYLMGFPMPCALARLDRGQPALVPWAWGVNGFASVLAAPVATAIGMTWGFHFTGGIAILCYLVPVVAFKMLPSSRRAV